MTTQEEVEELRHLDELYVRAERSNREEDWFAYNDARRRYEQRRMP